ncbi:MAG: hypothetical protein M3O74_30515 [Pseudomonadota bacterium]|nr:hypothetical protein [Pseudomonadota bacterium]
MKNSLDILVTVREHLLTQRAISEDESGTCRLRGRDGGRCAIGILIQDQYYCEGLEGVGISYYTTGQDGPLLRALLSSGVNAYEPTVGALLRDLEDLHDRGEISEWEAQLDELAWRHLGAGLAMTEEVLG